MPGYAELEIPWDSQPQEAAQPDPNIGASGLWNFAENVDAATGVLSTINPTYASRVVTEFGLGVSVTGTAALDRYKLGGASAGYIGAGDFTVVTKFRFDGNGNSYSLLGRWNTGASVSTCDWYLGSSATFGVGTKASFVVAVGSTIYTSEVTASWVAGRWYTLIGRRRGTTISVDRFDHNDGSWLSASTTNAGITTVNHNSARSLKLGEIDAGATYNLAATYIVAATVPAYLENARDYAQQPWQLFAPQSIWVPVSAGGAPPSIKSPYYHQMIGDYHV